MFWHRWYSILCWSSANTRHLDPRCSCSDDRRREWSSELTCRPVSKNAIVLTTGQQYRSKGHAINLLKSLNCINLLQTPPHIVRIAFVSLWQLAYVLKEEPIHKIGRLSFVPIHSKAVAITIYFIVPANIILPSAIMSLEFPQQNGAHGLSLHPTQLTTLYITTQTVWRNIYITELLIT
jgi:hypothetical protein